MIYKSIDLPDQEFDSLVSLYKALKLNAEKIIGLKKAVIRKTRNVKQFYSNDPIQNKSKTREKGFIYPVINTTNFLDSHKDVHMNGLWDKSVKDKQGKVYFLEDHQFSIKTVIAYPKDVVMYVELMNWKELGQPFSGETEALTFKVSIQKIRSKDVLDIIEEKIDIEHSISMQYVTVYLCVNSDDEEFKDEKYSWSKYYPYIANKEEADELGYFWAVTEAKIAHEGSMVLAGSNSATPLLYGEGEEEKRIKKIEPLDNTQIQEPSDDTLKSKFYLY